MDLDGSPAPAPPVTVSAVVAPAEPAPATAPAAPPVATEAVVAPAESAPAAPATAPSVVAPVAVPVVAPPAEDPVADTHEYFMGTDLGSRPPKGRARFASFTDRFRVLPDGEVADAMLGKVWVLYKPGEVMTLADALADAQRLKGRLPTAQELGSLLVLDHGPPDWRVNVRFFPMHQRTALFWCSKPGLLGGFSMLRPVVDLSEGVMRSKSSDDQCGVLVIRDQKEDGGAAGVQE